MLEAHPFQPFQVSLADGRKFAIASPDMIWMPAEGRGGLHMFVPEQDRIVSANLLLVTSVDWSSSTGAPE